jgi:DNA-directed RNA polymerase specialized sigma subunit
MEYYSQDDFENSVILESELKSSYNENGYAKRANLENMVYNKIDGIQLERGEDLSEEERTNRNIYVWYKLNQLTEEEKKIAWLYYVEGRTKEEISKILDVYKANDRGKKINKTTKVSRVAILYKIKKIEKKLKS